MKAYEAYKAMMVSKDIMDGLNDMRNNLHNGVALAQMVLEFRERMPDTLIRQSELVLSGAEFDGWPEAINAKADRIARQKKDV